MITPLHVCYGIEGEYVLAPLAAALGAAGLDCVEIMANRACDAGGAIDALPEGRPRILIACAHLLHDGPAMIDYLGIPGCLSLPEVLDRLRPDRAVYYPHDLTTPVLQVEAPFLRLFDLYLGVRVEERAFSRYLPVEIVGWSKFAPGGPPPERRGRALWLFSDVESRIRRRGVDAVFDLIRPFMRPWCAIKFAPYAAVRPLEEKLTEAGFSVVPSGVTAPAAVAAFDMVLCNGESSVVQETGLMGKPVFILTAPEITPASLLRRMGLFAANPGIRFVADLDAVPQTAPSHPPVLRPFDPAAAVAAIRRLWPAA